MTAITQAEFARQAGYAKSYVTALKHAGRLVLTDDGRVDPVASIARIEATRDPNRDDIAARRASRRAALQAPAAPATEPANADGAAPKEKPAVVAAGASADRSEVGRSYQEARALKERYAALSARLEYERAAGIMIERAAVAEAVADVVIALRQTLEQLPHRVAPELVGCDLDTIRVRIKREVSAALADLARQMRERLQQIAGAEDVAA
jgi:hypothetical protein